METLGLFMLFLIPASIFFLLGWWMHRLTGSDPMIFVGDLFFLRYESFWTPCSTDVPQDTTYLPHHAA